MVSKNTTIIATDATKSVGTRSNNWDMYVHVNVRKNPYPGSNHKHWVSQR